jgi:hypothetical protein
MRAVLFVLVLIWSYLMGVYFVARRQRRPFRPSDYRVYHLDLVGYVVKEVRESGLVSLARPDVLFLVVHYALIGVVVGLVVAKLIR